MQNGYGNNLFSLIKKLNQNNISAHFRDHSKSGEGSKPNKITTIADNPNESQTGNKLCFPISLISFSGSRMYMTIITLI